MKHLFAAVIILWMVASGCSESPTAPIGPPQHGIVGTWTLTWMDLIDTMVRQVETLLVETFIIQQGVSRARAEQLVADIIAISGLTQIKREFKEDMRQSFVGTERYIVRYNEDNTWKDNIGDRGTWRMVDGDLVTTNKEGREYTVGYFIDGDELTLIYAKKLFLEIPLQEQDADPFDRLMLQIVMENHPDVVRLIFKRK